MNRSSAFLLLQLLLLLLCFTLGTGWKDFISQHRTTSKLEHEHDELVQFVSQATPEKMLSRIGTEVFCLTKGLPVAEANLQAQAFLNRGRLSPTSFELRLFGANDRPLDAPPTEAASWTMVWKRIRLSSLTGQARNPTTAPQSIEFLRGGVGIEDFQGRPGEARQLGSSDQRTWMYWNWEKPTRPAASGTVAGFMLFLHRQGLTLPTIVEWSLARHKKWTGRTGLINIATTSPILSTGLPPSWPREALISHLQGNPPPKGASFRLGQHWFLAVPVTREIFLLASRPADPRQVPPWSWALVLLWFGFQLGQRRLIPGSLSLKSLLQGLISLIIVLPVLASLSYWHRFHETETTRLIREAQTELQLNLIQIDEAFALVARDNQRQYRRLLKAFRSSGGRMDYISTELNRLELDGVYDTLLLVSSAGVPLRPFSTSPSNLRRIGLLPPAKRPPYLQALHQQGFNPHHQEVKFVNTFRLERDGPEPFSSYRNTSDVTETTKMAMTFFADLLAEHDRRQNLAPRGAQKESMTGLIMSTFLEGQEENPLEIMLGNLGRFFRMGTGQQQIQVFLDVVTDAIGRGSIIAMFFHQQETLEDLFLRRVFLREAHWPTQTRFLALSHHWMAFHYPRLRSDRFWGFVEQELQPPRRLLSRRVRYRGEDCLMAAYAATNLSHYHLIAVQPLRHVLSRLTSLENRLKNGAAILATLILIVALLLHRLLVAPMRGIAEGMQALEHHDHSFRIALRTGDEWESLANAFNQSLATGEEMEVARQVQRHILPQGRLTHGRCSFEAVSRMMTQVGGDFYDAVELSGQRQMFILGDVSGHGVSAALVVAMAKAAFRCLARPDLEDPAELLQSMNRLFLEQLRRIKMMTCFVGIISESGLLQYCNAGHVYPMIIRPGEALDSLRQVGLPLGISSKKAFKSLTVPFPAGSRLVLFTDGITEALDAQKEMFGFDRLESLVDRLAKKPAPDFFRGFFSAFEAFCAAGEWHDDVTIGLVELAPDEQNTVSPRP